MHKQAILMIVLALVLVTSVGCANLGPAATPAPPTKTPKPTFTLTPNWTPTAEVFPTATAVPPTTAPVVLATPVPTIPPPPTVAPNPRLTASQTVNVRGGPGTNYARIGQVNAGQSFDITGKNPSGDWYQFNLNGRSGWIVGRLVTVSGAVDNVQVAQNIPAPPPTARPTARPAPTARPQPTSPPAPRYEFNIAVVQKCERQPAGNWFDGTVYKGGSPSNGHRVVFSYSPDGPHITPPQISGPHEGYEGWNPGYYSHIINAAGPKSGSWYVWIVDATGNRISEMANWNSTGPGDGCNQATVDFDSR
jgi:uncharacterized protein YraI